MRRRRSEHSLCRETPGVVYHSRRIAQARTVRCKWTREPMTNDISTVRLKIVRRSAHPWIFQKMVEKPDKRLPGGSVVDIVDRDNQWVGRGFYNGHSRIALRVLTNDPAEMIDSAFFARRLERCITLRRDWLRLDAVTDAYRLVHSEGD